VGSGWRAAAHPFYVLVPKLRLGAVDSKLRVESFAAECRGISRKAIEAELRPMRSQAELGNELEAR